MIVLLAWELGLADNYLHGDDRKVLDRLWTRFRESLLGHTVDRQGINRRRVVDVLNQQNKPMDLKWCQRLMLRARFTSKGIAIGSKEFIDNLLKENKDVLNYRRKHKPEEARSWDRVYCLKKHRIWIG